MTSDLRARLAGARLYLCTDPRRSQGDLPEVPEAGPGARGALAPPRAEAAALPRQVAGQHPGRPWFAIGGIGLDRLDDVLAAEATRVVVVRAITEADDPAAATRAFASRLR